MLRIGLPAHQIPLFARHGSVIPIAAVADRTPEGPLPEVSLLSFGGSSCEINDDNGTSVMTICETDVNVSGPAQVTGVEVWPSVADQG